MRSPSQPASPPEPTPLLVEPLEPRIAPAAIDAGAATDPTKLVSVTLGTPQFLRAGQILTTGQGGGAYLLYVEQGAIEVFTTDLNGNRNFDPNEITGIAAGPGLRLTLFSDVHGDIVTNLQVNSTGDNGDLTDSDNDATNGRDGRVLLPNSIESITLRTITAADLDSTIPGNTVNNRIAFTTYSIHGNIFTGGDFGVAGRGLLIDTSGAATVNANFGTGVASPQIGDIRVGSAAGLQTFHFGNSVNVNGFGPVDPTRQDVDVQGELLAFNPAPGQHGADITGVKSMNNAPFSVGTLATGRGGDGGAGAGGRGGNFTEVTLSGDHGGYQLLAGDGGSGVNGGAGGAIVNFADIGTNTGEVILHTGSGGQGTLGRGGDAGALTLGTTSLAANLRIFLGDGGDGVTGGGNGASLPTGVISTPAGQVPVGGQLLSTMRDAYVFMDPATGQRTFLPAPNTGAQLQFTNIIPGDPTSRLIPFHAFDNGTTRPIDFDGDGRFDALFTSSNPEQIVVLFGNGAGGFDQSKTLFLDAPFNTQAITVADFNADGRPDIAAASADGANVAGVTVFINQINDPVHNPVVNPRPGFTDAFTRNPLGDQPFSGARQSAIPTLSGTLLGGSANVPILALKAGDFNGDGVMDLAYVGSYARVFSTGRSDVVVLLFGDTTAQHPYGTGFFFANTALPTDGRSLALGLVGAAGVPLSVVLEAGVGSNQTILGANTPRHDQLFGSEVGNRAVREFEVLLGQDAQPLLPINFISDPTIQLSTNFTGNGDDPDEGDLGIVNLLLDPLLRFSISLGQVDTNRLAPTIDPMTGVINNNLTGTAAQLQDLTVAVTVQPNQPGLDINNPANFDANNAANYRPPTIGVLTSQPQSFALIFSGNGSPAGGSFADLSAGGQGVGATLSIGGSQRGVKLTQPDGILSGPDPSNLRAVIAIDANNDGVFNELGFYDLAGGVRVYETTIKNPFLGLAATALAPSGNAALTQNGNVKIVGTTSADITVTSFDFYRFSLRTPALPTDPTFAFGAINPSRGSNNNDFVAFSSIGRFVFEPTIDNAAFNPNVVAGNISPSAGINRFARTGFVGEEAQTLTDNGIRIFAGNGGTGFAGPGGQGGFVGNGAFTAGAAGAATGGLAITIGAFPSYKGILTFNGGAGGSGFNVGGGVSTAGGNGGDLDGITTRGISSQFNVGTRAGDGGFGVNGPGGRGGDIADSSFVAGNSLISGDGGGGLQGGRAGNINGNNRGIFDAVAARDFVVSAGLGGRGSLAGGAGGNIANLVPQFVTASFGLSTGINLDYNVERPIAGNGGAAAGGAAGAGGNVINSSPDSTVNLLSGDVGVRSGNGGDGLRGGNGGRIDTFINRPSDQSVVPDNFLFLGGDGGAGITDVGGNGGTVQAVSINGVGPLVPSSLLTNRVLGGAGGPSFGATGGTGGFITGVTATSVSTPLAIASGAGGLGLTSGRDGGAVSNNTFNAAGTGLRFGKLLVIAGAGGDAYARLPGDVIVPGDGETADLIHQALGFGGVSGVGGNGASINNLTQPISVQTNVDLIAGNGGSTVTYGTTLDATVNVGRGGSVTNVNALGEIGTSLRDTATNVSPPIKAYNDFNNDGILDQTLAEFVAENLRPGTFFLDNFSATGGNVGIVAGAAGSVAAINGVPQPASGATNGAVQNITARNIMSIVAGSVDAVAPVDNVTGLRLTGADRILGADKSPTFPAFGPATPGFRADGAANSLVEFFAPNSPTDPTSILTGQIVPDLQPGYRLIDGAIFASANSTGDLANQLGNARVVIQP